MDSPHPQARHRVAKVIRSGFKVGNTMNASVDVDVTFAINTEGSALATTDRAWDVYTALIVWLAASIKTDAVLHQGFTTPW